MKIDKKPFIIAVLIPLLTGGLSALLSGSMKGFSSLVKPPLSPPGWLFPVVWTVLYILMGIASYFIYKSNTASAEKNSALIVYGAQLFFNFLWSIIFFRFEAYFAAFVWIILLWILIIFNIIKFYKISKPAAYLLIPYLLWVTFAAYLNLGIYLLN